MLLTIAGFAAAGAGVGTVIGLFAYAMWAAKQAVANPPGRTKYVVLGILFGILIGAVVGFAVNAAFGTDTPATAAADRTMQFFQPATPTATPTAVSGVQATATAAARGAATAEAAMAATAAAVDLLPFIEEDSAVMATATAQAAPPTATPDPPVTAPTP